VAAGGRRGKILAAAHLSYNPTLEPSCRVCRLAGSGELRERWGCDGPAARPVFTTSCPRCFGFSGGQECPRCGGLGEVTYTRCPAVVADDAGPAMRAYSDCKAGYGMPAPGGLAEQAGAFADAVLLIDMERGRIDAEREQARPQAAAPAPAARGA
jgi:hypothetical protein